jgi:diguanylate cyclase (GGDEF)-like protein
VSFATPPPGRVARPIHPGVVRDVLRYVEHAAGVEARDRLLAELPAHRRAGDVVDPHRWVSRGELNDVVAAAARLCGDDQIGRRAGEEKFRAGLLSPFGAELAATGSVEAACERVVARYAKVSLSRRPVVVANGTDHVLLESHYLDPAGANRFACDYQAGYFSQLPTLFGLLGTAVEMECRARGDARCVLRLAWRPDPVHTPVDRLGSARDEDVTWFEEAQATAAKLVGASDVEELLDEVVRQACQTFAAPQVLLTARLRGDHAPRVHHTGFDDDRADALAGHLAAGTLEHDEHVAIADIASAARTYGRLAAVFPAGSTITADERRKLHAYAEHVASALHALASLEGARRDRDTARALLSLARAFAEVTSVHDVTTRLTKAIPEVTGCDLATVWLFDADRRSIRLVGSEDRAGNEQPLEPKHLFVDDFPDLVAAMRSRRPTLLDAVAAPAVIRPYLTQTGIAELAMVPIAGNGHLLGIVTAGFTTAIGSFEHGSLFERLRGLTAHASTALQNAHLLERMRHEAMHDTLTGLPNRSLVEGRGRQALSAVERTGNRVAVLFLDLDGFKEINDTHGHFVGDALIRHVAARLDGLMRVSDTVGRLGGDEFVVLMPDVETEQDALDVAARIIAAFRRPINVEGRSVSVSCSIGVASSGSCAPYDDLLRRADAAMYAAKAAGGRRYAVDDPVVALPPEALVAIDLPSLGG